MSPSPTAYRIKGFHAPVRGTPSFVLPLFARDGADDLFAQVVSPDGARTDFVQVERPADLIPPAGDLLVERTGPPVYAFQFADARVCGTADEVAAELRTRLEQLRRHPFVFLEVCDFLGLDRELPAAYDRARAALRPETGARAARRWRTDSGPAGPAAFAEVLRAELAAVRARRTRALGIGHPDAPVAPVSDDPRPVRVAAARADALELNLVGLAFSGGGIRSGTLAVGFLQGLAKLRLLRLFDYLSTVSGGGYAGAWFAAWVKREGDLERVEKQLDPSRHAQGEAGRRLPQARGNHAAVREWTSDKLAEARRVLDQEPEPVNHLRAHSRYLTPRAGLFTADTWTLLGSYLRNTTINLCIITAMTLVLLFAARWLIWAFVQPGEAGGDTFRRVTRWVSYGGIGLAALALFLMGWYRSWVALAAGEPTAVPRSSESRRAWFVVAVVGFLTVASVVACWSFGLDPGTAGGPVAIDTAPSRLSLWVGEDEATTPVPVGPKTVVTVERLPDRLPGMLKKSVVLFVVPGAALSLLGFVVRLARRYVGPGYRISLFDNARLLLSGVVMTATAGLAMAAALRFVVWPLSASDRYGTAAVVTLGPPTILVAFIVGGVAETMLFARGLWDYELEWRGKVIGYLLMAGVAWLAFFAATLWLPHAVVRLDDELQRGIDGKPVTPLAIISWVLTTVAGVLFGRREPGGGRLDRVFTVVRVVAPTMFVVGFLALLSVLAAAIVGDGEFPRSLKLVTAEGSAEQGGSVCWAGFLSVISLVVLNLTIGATSFSFHNLYGNRLTRCYLGASRPKACAVDPDARPSFPGGAPTGVAGPFRRENPVTGFDPNDDFPLSDLRPGPGFAGPYPLFNTALQLVAGDQLAWQDRKAASFALTPDFCGCEGTGWAPTPTDRRTEFTVGQAMTTSGAAIDPNMANYQSAPLTVFLTVFNARTGVWIRNPAHFSQSTLDQPAVGWFGLPLALTLELLGQTNEKRSHVHLSDGGSFENLGVYELVRRRCRFVVACDFAEDLHDASENLANLVRRVAVDFGIRIDIDTSPVRKDDDGISPRHVTVGRIHYEDVDENAVAGTLVFVRSSLTGDESPAIRQYADTHPDFPHQSTANQFFDADQFEAYRALGEHMAGAVFAPVAREMNWARVRDGTGEHYKRQVRRLFASLRREWYPQPAGLRAQYTDNGGAFDRLMAELRAEPGLAGLVRTLYPELTEPGRPIPAALPAGLSADDTARLLAVNQIINLMETVWVNLDLDRSWAQPFNRGWVNEFRRWTAAADFQACWPILRGEYSPGFVRFCERQLNAPIVTPEPVRFDPADPEHRRWAADLNAAFLDEWCESRRVWPRVTPAFQTIREAVLGEPDPLVSRARPIIAGPAQGTDGEPLCWFATLPLRVADATSNSSARVRPYAIGVVVIYERQDADVAGAGRQFEVLMWFRGAYRSMNLGRQTIEGPDPGHPDRKLYEAVGEHLGRGATLVARYPRSDVTGAGRLQESNWANFFYDYDFRRRRPKSGAGPDTEDGNFAVLERTL